LDVFINIARSDDIDLNVVECGEECWTYGDLDIISTGLAFETYRKWGLKPVVAVISENHPFILATILAIWKLGGIVAPMDCNTPHNIMERMLLNTRPTFVLVPSNQLIIRKIVEGGAYFFFHFRIYLFDHDSYFFVLCGF